MRYARRHFQLSVLEELRRISELCCQRCDGKTKDSAAPKLLVNSGKRRRDSVVLASGPGHKLSSLPCAQGQRIGTAVRRIVRKRPALKVLNDLTTNYIGFSARVSQSL